MSSLKCDRISDFICSAVTIAYRLPYSSGRWGRWSGEVGRTLATRATARRRAKPPLWNSSRFTQLTLLTNLLFQVFCGSRIEVIRRFSFKHTQLLYGLMALLIKDARHEAIVTQAAEGVDGSFDFPHAVLSHLFPQLFAV